MNLCKLSLSVWLSHKTPHILHWPHRAEYASKYNIFINNRSHLITMNMMDGLCISPHCHSLPIVSPSQFIIRIIHELKKWITKCHITQCHVLFLRIHIKLNSVNKRWYMKCYDIHEVWLCKEHVGLLAEKKGHIIRVATRLSEKISLTFPWQFPDCHYKFQSLSWYIPCGEFLQYIQNHIEIVVSTRERFQNHMNCRHLMPADHYAKHENKLSSEKNHLANDIWLGTLFEILS